MRDLYSVLQVAPKATDAEIKSAFRTLAKACHPDVRPGDREAELAFHEARQAYRLLTNPEKRRAYDAFLADHRAAERARQRRAAARTMSASFLLTVVAVVFAAAWWHGRLPLGQIASAAVEHTGAYEVPRGGE